MKLDQNDWKILCPTETFQLGNTQLEIKPMAIEHLPKVVRDMKNILAKLKSENLNMSRENIAEVIARCLSESTAVISTLSGLDIEDVRRLPVPVLVDLATKCIEVNITSQEDFLKNLMALVMKSTKMIEITAGVLEQ